MSKPINSRKVPTTKTMYGDSVTRSEFDDSLLRHNTRADNRLSRELKIYDRAQKAVLSDLGKESHILRTKLQLTQNGYPKKPVSSSQYIPNRMRNGAGYSAPETLRLPDQSRGRRSGSSFIGSSETASQRTKSRESNLSASSRDSTNSTDNGVTNVVKETDFSGLKATHARSMKTSTSKKHVVKR